MTAELKTELLKVNRRFERLKPGWGVVVWGGGQEGIGGTGKLN